MRDASDLHHSEHCEATQEDGDQKTPRKRDLENEIWKTDCWYWYRKMDMAAEKKSGWKQMVTGIHAKLRVSRHKLTK